jgi:hypothetical protein
MQKLFGALRRRHQTSMDAAGVVGAQVIAQDGRQPLQSPEVCQPSGMLPARKPPRKRSFIVESRKNRLPTALSTVRPGWPRNSAATAARASSG